MSAQKTPASKSSSPGFDAGTPAPNTQPGTTALFTPVVATVCGVLALLVFLAFGKSLRYGFLNWDDIIYIRDYPQVTAGLSLKGFVWAWTHPHYSNWHPLTTLSFMFDSTVFGSNGAGFHTHNVILQGITAVLLFLALRVSTGTLWRSAFAAAIFAIHPLRVESVVWITERKDVLSGLFLMATLLAYALYAKTPSRLRFICVCFLFACGLLSKSVLVPLPLLLLLLDIWPLQRLKCFSEIPLSQNLGTLWRLVREKAPLILLSAGSCFATILSVDLHRPMTPPPFLSRLAYIPVWCVAYVRQFLFPTDLGAHYPYVQSGPLVSTTLWSLLLLVVISSACWKLRKQLPVLIVAWAWFLIALLPVIGIIPPGIQIMADRYTYVAQVFFGVALAWIGYESVHSWKRKWLPPLLAISLTGGLVALSINQTGYWSTDELLWRHTVAVTQENDFANGQLGDSLAVNNRLNEAEPYYREALRLNPNLAGVLNNLAIVVRSQGKLAESESLLKRATEVSPWFAGARLDLANTQIAQRKFAEAKETLLEIIKQNPNSYDAIFRMGVILSEGDPSKADFKGSIDYLNQAAKIQPDNPQTYFSLGNAYFLSGKITEAIDNFKITIQKDPKHARAANNLGTTLARANRIVEAASAYRLAIQNDKNYLDAYDGLADVLVRSKDPEEAIRTWKAALTQNPNDIRSNYKLAWILSTYPDERIRNGKEAETFAQKGIELSGGKEGILYDSLAAALAEQGRFEEAVQYDQKALELLTAAQNTAAVEAIRPRLESYRNRRPVRIAP